MNEDESTREALTAPPSRWSRTNIIVAGFVIFILADLFAVIVPQAQLRSRRRSCEYRLQQIGLAFETYYDTNNRFPSAYIVDSQGRKYRSWREKILPFVEGTNFHSAWNVPNTSSEPWDGPNNRKFWEQMPITYRCPNDFVSPPYVTGYAAVVGSETMWSGDKYCPKTAFQDDVSNTIMVVEAHTAQIPWLEPRDLDFGSMSFVVNDRSTQNCVSSLHRGGANPLFADGSVRFLSNDTDPQVLKTLLTIAGGERANPP
jgi:prepilin-type processing-associated H-X9-DG protein